MNTHCTAGRSNSALVAPWAAALAATALVSPSAEATIISNADLDHEVQPGELYKLPGLPEFEFGSKPKWPGALWLGQSHPGARLAAPLWSWGDHPVNPDFHNGNPGYVALGVLIGAGHYDPWYGGIWYNSGGTYSGTEQDHGYLGFSFDRDDGKHYGWVHVTVKEGFRLTVHGYGYEDVAGAAILSGAVASVPEPDTLALAAAGVVAAAVARRRRRGASSASA